MEYKMVVFYHPQKFEINLQFETICYNNSIWIYLGGFMKKKNESLINQNQCNSVILRGFLFHSERGYTLIETLVASAILLGVLIPASLFLGRFTAQRRARDLVVAYQLAGAELERTAAHRLFKNDEWFFSQDNKEWRIVRWVESRRGLVFIRVQVFRQNGDRVLVEMKTLRGEDQ